MNNLISRLTEYSDTIRIVRIRDKEQDSFSEEYSPETIIKGYANWLQKNLENEELAELIIETISKYEDRSLEKALTLSSNIVGMTCNRVGAYSYDASAEMFDVVIIDEVCKATLPEILMPLTVSKKAILVGDPKQLPPVFCSEELVIFSLTRTHGSYRFLADARRLNVALSRAKDSIYMVGCLKYAKENNLLNAVSSYCDIEFLADL